jgi:hypothetical protein
MILISIFTNPECDFLGAHVGQPRTEFVHLSGSARAATPCDPRTQRLVNRPASIAGGHFAEEAPRVVIDHDIDASAHGQLIGNDLVCISLHTLAVQQNNQTCRQRVELILGVPVIVPWCAWEGVGKTLQVVD